MDLQDLVEDRPWQHNLSRLETHGPLFDQMRQALRIAPLSGDQGLNHGGEALAMKALQHHVQAFTREVRARPDYSTTPVLQKMIQQIDYYGPKLFADPLVVSTPEGPRTIQPQRTNNILERFFRDLKRDCRHKTGCHSLGRTWRTLLPDTPLVKNLQNPEYLKILLDGQPSLEALFAQIDPPTVRQELVKAQHIPDRVPRALQRFIHDLPNSTPIKNFILNAQSNPISLPQSAIVALGVIYPSSRAACRTGITASKTGRWGLSRVRIHPRSVEYLRAHEKQIQLGLTASGESR